VASKFPYGRDQSEDRHVDAGEDGLTIDPTDLDRLIARHRQITAAEKSLQRAIEEAAQEIEAERPDKA
jgi:hypothetical protein